MKFSNWQKYIIVGMFFLGAVVMYLLSIQPQPEEGNKMHWKFQSIDTMKTSRDRAREFKDSPNAAKIIDKQISLIAATGATYVAIGTPYDDEFLPVLQMWARSAHQHDLKVWFRGNWAGWEQWFGYGPIDEATHMQKTKQFILSNPDLFEDGDVFSSCPECENGAHFSPSNPAELPSYRQFLISDYQMTKAAFASIHKNVASNYYSMNLDVAKAVMNPATTKALDGLVVIDHYIKNPADLAQDVVYIGQLSGGKVILGETGAPIPDIHGTMTDDQQRKWLLDSLILLSANPNLVGMNYWVNKDGSTALWRSDDSPKPALEVLKQFYGAPATPTE